MRIISAAEANRRFSTVLRGVSQGDAYVVVSRGRPVATIGPFTACDAQRRAAREALMQRLQAEGVTGPCDWTRDGLYDDDACRA